MSQPILIGNQPSGLPALYPSGTGFLSTVFTAPASGSIVIKVGIASGSASSVLNIVRNGNTLGMNGAASSQALNVGDEYDFKVPVTVGETVNFAFATGTTLALFGALYQESL